MTVVAAVAAQEGNSKALVAAYDGRLLVQGLRSGVQCCWGVQHCVKGLEEVLMGGGSCAGG